MAFNINTKAIGDTTKVHLTDPSTDEKLFDEAGNAVSVEIYGKASKAYRQALSVLSRKSLQRKGKQQSFETNVEDNIDLLVTISKAAHNFEMDGAPVNSPEAFKALYNNPNLFWIKDQVQAALDDNANFTQK